MSIVSKTKELPFMIWPGEGFILTQVIRKRNIAIYIENAGNEYQLYSVIIIPSFHSLLVDGITYPSEEFYPTEGLGSLWTFSSFEDAFEKFQYLVTTLL